MIEANLTNVLIAGIISTLVSTFHRHLVIVAETVLEWLLGCFKVWTAGEQAEVIFTAYHYHNYEGIQNVASPAYRAVMHQVLKQQGVNVPRVYETASRLRTFSLNPESDTQRIRVCMDPGTEVVLCPQKDIRVYCFPPTKSGLNSSSVQAHVMKVSVRSRKLTVDEILDVIHAWKIEHHGDVMTYSASEELFFFQIMGEKNAAPSPQEKEIKEMRPVSSDITWKKNELRTFKSFDNIFFPSRDSVVQRLDFFLRNEDVYKRRGLPYTLGILLSGPPGTGKTSTIKAIAKYTNRHIVEINLQHIQTAEQFTQIFINTSIDGLYIPYDKRIIVLEDIDCMADVVRSREEGGEDLQKRNDLTLSCILNTIDGVLEQQGRILIITTNYEDRLDKALLRPGRIDVKVHLGRCTRSMAEALVTNFYDQKIEIPQGFKEDHYTPAELTEMCFRHENDVQGLLHYLGT